MKKRYLLPLLALAGAAVAAAIAWPRDQFVAASSPDAWAGSLDNVARGAYLARAGDCMACHTARGGEPYAGGRAIDTPFGRVVSPNITPDQANGIGGWSADDFWGALHNGKSKDGRMLYPAFPYPNYTRVTRADADALYAFLRTLPASARANDAHALRFPYNQQLSLAAWRLLYFKPAVFAEAPSRTAEWNRGAYLVEGLGHCGACHSSRNTLGAPSEGLAGGLIPMIGWYAPSLTSDAEAGLGNWEVPNIVQLLRTGVSPRATVMGPMAEVVQESLQHLTEKDVGAMAVYLKSLPNKAAPREKVVLGPEYGQVVEQGKRLYEANCVDCHGGDGKGLAPAYPPLAGNRAVTMESPVNAIRSVMNGGFPPGTTGNPKPYGMPPFSHVLNDAEAAALLTYVRSSWGNGAGPVSVQEVNRYRAVPLE